MSKQQAKAIFKDGVTTWEEKTMHEYTDLIYEDMEIKDTGWMELKLEGNVKPGTVIGKPEYRVIDNKVKIRGSITGLGDGRSVLVAKLPSKLAPTDQQYWFAATAGAHISRFLVRTNGEIIHDWRVNLADGSYVPGAAWQDISYEWYVD